MRSPRARLTLRRLMIAVAVFGLLLGGWAEIRRLNRQSPKYRSRARSHREEEAMALGRQRSLTWDYRRSASERSSADLGDFQVVFGASDDQLASMKRQVDEVASEVNYHRAMAEKYEAAARHPWLPLPSGPTKPSGCPF